MRKELKMNTVKGKKIRNSFSACLEKEIDSFLEAIHDDILIADDKGVVLNVSATFEEVYGIQKKKAVGMTVYELEKQGYFKPSITALVLETGERITMSQKNNCGRTIVVTATPIKDEQGKIRKVISFSRDVTDFLTLKEQYSELENKMARYKEELGALRRDQLEMNGLITKDERSQAILKTVKQIAPFDTNVMITGESGVGKSLFAKLIHNISKRRKGPFIELNCGAIPENLLESELFGYEKGSFSGASEGGKIGLIELAHNGTLFLDEIADLPMKLQVKILKVIQDKVITKVGGVKEISVDFRLISATNKDLKTLMKEGLFREDLYYRLNVISIEVPPLRERQGDIIPMITYFVSKINQQYQLQKSLSKEVFDHLVSYNWPGNIRELENLLERTLLTAEHDLILAADLPPQMRSTSQTKSHKNQHDSLPAALEALERAYILDAWSKTGTTIGVAKLLQISQPTAVRKIQKYVRNQP